VGIAYISALASARRLLDRYDLVLGAMLCWLLYMSNSKTSLTCLVVAIAVLAVSRIHVVSRQPTRLVTVVLLTTGVYLGADALFQVQDHVLQLLGRSPTLTNRTDVWAVLRGFETDPVVGAGFMSFWSGERMAAIWRATGSRLNQAHNGYLEQYLNLGYIGVGFIAVIATTALLKVKAHLSSDYSFGILRLCLLVAALLYNYTEASFCGISNIWVLFLAASIGSVSQEHAELQAVPARGRTLARRQRRLQPMGELARVGRARTAAAIGHRDKRAEGRVK
jgi:O-antigen ligase